MKFAFVSLLVSSTLAFSQQHAPVFLTPAQSDKLLIIGPDNGRVFNAMRANHLDSAWAEAQILVDERGQVVGVQNVRGTGAILAAFVGECSRSHFHPYIESGVSLPFATLLKFKYAVQSVQPTCSLWNRSSCR
jgi:hypothetical protein